MALLKELLMIEWQRRLCLGEQPLLEEYTGRFPEQARWIQKAIPGRYAGLETTIDFVLPAKSTSDQLPHLRDYEVLEKVGGGGMGVVYKARKRSRLDGGFVALKMIADHLVSRDSIERFIIEMRNQARHQHPHIVHILDSGQDDCRPYFTMLFHGGGDLSDVLKEHGRLEPTMAARYISRIAWAVHYLHDQDEPLLHRDLKSRNIVLDHYCDENFPYGRPYLADFGLVRALEKTSLIFAERPIEGTIPYMAPEQAEGRKVVPASDVWGLGVVLFECLTGDLPFRGETDAETIYQILHRETPSPRAAHPAIPRELERICLKCLKKPLASRYQSVRELIDDLECFFKADPLPHARPQGLGERVIQWARRAPALAARLAVIVACSAIIWGYPLVVGRFAPLAPDHPIATIHRHLGFSASEAMTTAILVWANQIILLAWGLISWAFQRRLNRSPRDDGIQLGWRIADVTALVLLIQLDDALMSPLTVAFGVLIAASAFSSRPNQIIQTTLLSMAGYVVLALTYRYSHPSLDRPYRHFQYLAGLTILCVILVFQASRTRTLARIGGERLRA
jgi:hypothetical protein